MKSGSLNLLEPSGPLQAFKGIALPFTHEFLIFLLFIFTHIPLYAHFLSYLIFSVYHLHTVLACSV